MEQILFPDLTPADSTNDEPETVTSEPDSMSVCPSASSSGTAGSATATSLQSRVSTETDPVETDPVEPDPVEPDSKENTFARQCTVDVLVEATKKNDQSAKRVLTLHNLIMKVSFYSFYGVHSDGISTLKRVFSLRFWPGSKSWCPSRGWRPCTCIRCGCSWNVCVLPFVTNLITICSQSIYPHHST